ncbi:uncharacterized protein LOC128201104 [Galleria mellonella]|uniref:Uncharacterized protein LOC128201104 n=1 Tax=Galleria mellonella TaxID=7137 RepID=A0ABM3MN45_GALME|nr:uncharacterized protein LOC128201104 [Galleria mellonella]
MCKKFICPCPFWTAEDVQLASHPVHRTPIDKLGFTFRCCWCIPLRLATIFVCLVTFMWAALELIGVKKLMSDIFEGDSAVYYTSMIYIFLTISLILASGILLIGIIVRQYKSQLVDKESRNITVKSCFAAFDGECGGTALNTLYSIRMINTHLSSFYITDTLAQYGDLGAYIPDDKNQCKK